MLKQQNQLFAAFLAAADGVLIAGAAFAAWAFRVEARGEVYPESWENYLKEPQLLIAIPAGLLALKAVGLYKPRRDKRIVGEIGLIARAAMLTTVGVILTLWLIGADIIVNTASTAVAPHEPGGRALTDVDAARVQFPAFALLMGLLLSVQRTAFRLFLRFVRDRGWNLRSVAIVGTGSLGQIVARRLANNSWTGLTVRYYISHMPGTQRRQCAGLPVRGGLDDLEAVLDESPVDGVYLAIPQRDAALIPDLLHRLERYPVDVRIVPDFRSRFVPRRMVVSELEGMPIVSYRESPTFGLGGVSKRLLDILGASVALVLFSPLMLGIAIAIRLTSPGRAIYKQRRVGLAGEVFKIYKFRTMSIGRDADEEPSWTTRDDPRITPLGHLLRRTSLDELPQLVNVLQGRMSLVGPRPERPELIQRFREDRRRYMLRQHVKAGITGWAQINGLRGDTSLKKRLQYDLFYIRNWSLGFDIRILFATIFRGFVHRNAH